MTTSDVVFSSVVPVLPVEDFATAVAFYRERLGFEPLFEVDRYGGVARGGIELHVDGVSGRGVGQVTVRVSTDRVDDLFAELDRAGVVDPAEPLHDTPWGTRQFSVLDCSGNRLTFVRA